MKLLKYLKFLPLSNASMIILLVCFSFAISNNAKAQQDFSENYLVDKIYDYNHSLVAEYFYDIDNRLIRKIVTDNPGVQRRWVDEFEYENGRISKIIHDDQTYDFDYEILISYNTLGQLTRRETYKNGLLVGHSNFHYENNKVVSIYNDSTMPFEFDTIFYDSSGNVTKHVHIYPKLNDFGQPIPGEFRVVEDIYEYDENLKPNFGIDYLFIYDPLPYNDAAVFERRLSKNNMTKAINEKNSWIYTINEFGLPETIETIWDEIPTVDPMMLRIVYKQLNVSTIEIGKVPDEVSIYPNPVANSCFIESKAADKIMIYDISNKMIFIQNTSPNTEIDLSHLSKGAYFVSIFSKNEIISVKKIVKQ